MTKTVPKLKGDWLVCPSTKALMSIFERAGYEARFVGGVVRNALLGEPVGDLDLATNAPPQTVLALAKEAGVRAIPTGIDHGTVTVVIGERTYEITTLRVDVETDGRRARIAYTDDWAADAARRDFTMNALYVRGDGTLVDPLGGYEDLLARKVRFIGSPEHRIKEDYLRILRFFRFSAHYGGGQVEQEGLAACTRLQGGLRTLSSERVWQELKRLLPMSHAAPVLEVMFGAGVLTLLLAKVPHLKRFARWRALERELSLEPLAIDRLGALAVLVTEDADALGGRLRLSKKEHRALALWGAAAEFVRPVDERQARKALYRFKEDYQPRIAISWLLSGAAPSSRDWRFLYDLPRRWRAPEFPLKGRDLVEAGLKPGPQVGKKLLKLKRDWIDSDFSCTRAQLLKGL